MKKIQKRSRRIARRKAGGARGIISIFSVIAVGIVSLFLLTSILRLQHTSLVLNKSLVKKIKTFPLRANKAVCDKPGKGTAMCHAKVVVDNAGNPMETSTPPSTSLGPVEFHTAYNLPCTPSGDVQSICNTPVSYGPQTIAIIDAYHSPTIENDLAVYSSYYGLPPCTKANGCLKVVNQNGGTTLPTTVNPGWALETSLDVEVAHAICQTCKILLVEASSNSIANLATATNTAAKLGATAISNSYGGSEWSGETSYDSYYKHPGIAVTVSSGDDGYGSEFPSSSPHVISVGGTTLQLYTDNTYAGESVWNGTGSGCSIYETANTWQTSLPNWSQTNCGTKRSAVDVAAVADPNTGAAVYDSTPYNGTSGWYQIGGTSLSAPLVAAVYALAGGAPANTNAGSVLYANYNTTNFHDIITGTNGTCSTVMCKGGAGYDGPTGLGTPNGLAGFGGVTSVTSTPTPTSVSPTASPTAMPTSTPTIQPTATPTPTPTPTKKCRWWQLGSCKR